MPIRIQDDLPAKAVSEQEDIFVMGEKRVVSQNIRPLQILILNLTPLKEDAKLQLLYALLNMPLQVDCAFSMTSSHEATYTSRDHTPDFYVFFDRIKHHHFDGLVITRVPVGNLFYEEMSYWKELYGIMEWSKTHMTSTFHICRGAQVELYYHYGIQEYPQKEKLSGAYRHKVLHHSVPLVRSIDDYIDCPHSHWTKVRHEDIVKHPELTILVESDEVDVLFLMDEIGWQIFVQRHPEHDCIALDGEYRRDKAWGMESKIPLHYHENDDPSGRPLLSWWSMANMLYMNWLDYHVYQVMPYLLEEGGKP